MPKNSIALVLLITLTLGPVSGLFGSIMDKINSYSNQSVRSLYGNALFFDVEDQRVSNYAINVADSPVAQNTYGDYAITTFGAIGPDDANVVFRDEKGDITDKLELVGSPPEYYFTDMVFIQQKYEEALVDLYYFRAESAWTQFDNNKRPAVDEAIAGTYWVAQQNGVTYTEEQIEAKFLEQLDEQLRPVADGFIDTFKNVASNLEEATNEFVSALKAYYLDPNLETFENVILVSFECEEKTDSVYLSWSEIFARIVGPISNGLMVALVSHGRDMEKEISSSLAPQIVSPVEISKAEKELVFRG